MRLISLIVSLVWFGWISWGHAQSRSWLVHPEALSRSTSLLETSTKRKRARVRVLFYGQSITEQGWSGAVAQWLKAQYPNADLAIENKALGGFAAQLLVRSAEVDLYPSYPDLVIFHVYGDHRRYEDIIRRIRERTTADILLQTDHVTREDDLTEETDPERLSPEFRPFGAFMNHKHLPEVAARYGAAICDVRGAWKAHLRRHGFSTERFLRDSAHLNARGEQLMARIIRGCLRDARTRADNPVHDPRVVRIPLDGETMFRDGVLSLPFTGNRVDVEGHLAGGRCEVRIDDKPPSALAGSYSLSRALAEEGGRWPVVFPRLGAASPMLESFRLVLERAEGPEADEPPYAFTLLSDRTGEEGRGRTDQDFVSARGSVRIAKDAWNIAYALKLAGRDPNPPGLHVSFYAVPHGTDAFFMPAAVTPDSPSSVTVFQVPERGAHTLTLTGESCAVDALVVYDPLAAAMNPSRSAVTRGASAR